MCPVWKNENKRETNTALPHHAMVGVQDDNGVAEPAPERQGFYEVLEVLIELKNGVIVEIGHPFIFLLLALGKNPPRGPESRPMGEEKVEVGEKRFRGFSL